MNSQLMRRGVRAGISLSIALLLVFVQPAYANGEHIHVGGLVLLGGVVFVGSLVVVFYLLLRSNADEADEGRDLGE